MKEVAKENTLEYWDEYDSSSIGVGAYTDEKLLKTYAKGEVLEVGCGRGSMLKKLIGVGSKTGIDPSKQAIDYAKSTATDASFVVGVAEKLPFKDNSFDFVYSLEVFEHVEEYELMVSEMVRVLKDGGVGFIQTPNYPAKRFYDFVYFLLKRRSELKDDYTHVTKFSFYKLSDVIKKHATIKYGCTRNILAGKMYPMKLLSRDSFLAKWIGQKSIVVFIKGT